MGLKEDWNRRRRVVGNGVTYSGMGLGRRGVEAAAIVSAGCDVERGETRRKEERAESGK